MRMISEEMVRLVRSQSAREAALARWRRYPKSERRRYARAIQRGLSAPKLKRKRVRRTRMNGGPRGA